MVPLTSEFVKYLFELESDPEVVKFQGYQPKTFAQCETYALESEQSWHACETPNWQEFSILLGDQFIGRVGFQIEEKAASIWFAILPRFQGSGFGTEAVREILEYLTQLGVSEAHADCEIENHPSASLLIKCGMVEQPSTDPELRMFTRNLVA